MPKRLPYYVKLRRHETKTTFFNYELVKFSKARKARGEPDLFQGIKKEKRSKFSKIPLYPSRYSYKVSLGPNSGFLGHS